MYAGLYLILLSFISFGAIIYANNCHSWKNYHFYGSINPHNIDDDEYMDDITDEEVEMQNPYSVI